MSMEWDDASWKLCILLVLGPTLSFEWWGGGAGRIATGERKDRKRTFGKFFKWRLRQLGFCLGGLSVVCGELYELSFVLNLSTTVVGIMMIIHDKLSDKPILAWQDSRG